MQRPRSDITTRLLIGMVASTAFAVICMTAYVVYAGLLKPHTPRTVAEREVAVYARLVQEEPGNADYHARYVHALVKTGELDRARDVLAEAKKLFGDSPPAALMVEEARLLDTQGDSKAALRLAEEALEVARSEREQREKELAESGTVIRVESQALLDAALLAADILEREGDLQDAIGYYDIVLEEDPTAADILVARGKAYERLGQLEEARTDYRTALEYIPDYPPALEALRALGE